MYEVHLSHETPNLGQPPITKRTFLVVDVFTICDKC